MILASLDPKAATAGAVTIHAIFSSPIPGWVSRINTAMFYGELYKFRAVVRLGEKTVEYNLGRRCIITSLSISLVFRKAIDAWRDRYSMSPRRFTIPAIQTNFHCAPLNFPAGRLHLNGEMTLNARGRAIKMVISVVPNGKSEMLMEARNKALRALTCA